MSSVTELLLLPDGRILVHNLTPAMAALLKEFDLQDKEMALRSSPGTGGTSPVSLTHDSSPLTLRLLAVPKARARERAPKRSAGSRRFVPPTVSKA